MIPDSNNINGLKKNYKNTVIYNNERSTNYSKLLKKRGLKPDSVLDLHGHSLYSAKLVLKKYIINCYEKNVRNILIITGKGQKNKGVLKEEVPKILNEKSLNKFLININIAPKHFGGEGALLIRIKNRRKN